MLDGALCSAVNCVLTVNESKIKLQCVNLRMKASQRLRQGFFLYILLYVTVVVLTVQSKDGTLVFTNESFSAVMSNGSPYILCSICYIRVVLTFQSIDVTLVCNFTNESISAMVFPTRIQYILLYVVVLTIQSSVTLRMKASQQLC